MFDTARRMQFPFMAGSSLPLTWRFPPLELPHDCEIESALSIGYGGLEAYGLRALEILQCMIERRNGGETGVASVQAVQGDAMWNAERQGLWSRELLEAALQVMPDVKTGRPEDLFSDNAAVYLIEYRDGLRTAVIMANDMLESWGFAVNLKGELEPSVSQFKTQEDEPYVHFAYLVEAIEHMIRTGQPPYPVERTLLTTGILDRVMHSLAADGQRLTTPELDVCYELVDWHFANHPKSSLTLSSD